MYKPSLMFDRMPEERRDPFKILGQVRPGFFASGACHILAELFVQLHGHEGFKVYIKPAKGFSGNHVYASEGTWAFDHNGWTREAELLAITEKEYNRKYPGWSYTKQIIEPAINALENFCKINNHRLPWQFAYLPWERAYNFILQFDEHPPQM